MLGMALANQLGPYWVTTGGNSTMEPSDLDQLRGSLSNYLMTQSAALAVILIAVIIHFPSKPKVRRCKNGIFKYFEIGWLEDFYLEELISQVSPSLVGEGDRLESLRQGLISLVSNKSALACIFAYSVSFGVEGHWIGVIQINYEKYGVPEIQVGMIVLATVLVTTTLGILLSR